MRTFRIIQETPDTIGYTLQEQGVLWGWNHIKWFADLDSAHKYLDDLKQWVRSPGPKLIRQETILERFD